MTDIPCQNIAPNQHQNHQQPINIKVALVGRPNVGKSMLINSITNSRLKVANFAGVTIQKTEVVFSDKKNHIITFIDLPGIYSLFPVTEDEKITCRFLKNGNYDLILNICDATNLPLSLDLTLALLSSHKKVILAANFMDEINNKTAEIDFDKLSDLTGIDCIGVSAKAKQNLTNLLALIDKNYHNKNNTSNKIRHSEPISEGISGINAILSEYISNLDTNLAFDLLIEKEEAYQLIHNKPFYPQLSSEIAKTKQNLCNIYGVKNIQSVFAQEYSSITKGICREVLKGNIYFKHKITDKIDNIFINKILGLPIFLGLMWLLFQLTFRLGEYPMILIENLLDWICNSLKPLLPTGVISSLILDGLLSGIGSVLLFLPNIFIIFLGITLFEKTGYIARIAFLLDGFFHYFGLHGKSFISLITGFGCSIPAYMSTRILQNKSERIITMIMIGFIPCSAKLSVFVLLCNAFFPPSQAANVLFGIYTGGIIMGLICAKLLKKVAFNNTADEIFAMEMPPYRLPSLKSLIINSWMRVRAYLNNAGTLIALASFMIWFLSYFPSYGNFELSFLAKISKFLEPIFYPLGFDWRMISSLFSGLLAKEVVISTLSILYHSAGEGLVHAIRNSIPFASGVSFIAFIFFYLPCVSAIAVFSKEVGQKKYVFFLFAFTTILAYLGAFCIHLICR